jgi:hypothetical protein
MELLNKPHGDWVHSLGDFGNAAVMAMVVQNRRVIMIH